MKFHHLLLLCITCFASLSSYAHAKRTVRQANIEKLLNPETRIAEVVRLRGYKNNKGGADIAEIRVITCPQKSGDPIYLLMVRDADDRDSYVSSLQSIGSDSYPKKETESLFKNALKKKRPKSNNNLTDSERIQDTVISFFKTNGTEIHLFGGNNYISNGYLYDFNRDGILDRIEHTNWGVHDNHSVQSLEVETVEENPKTLLHVVYNWHPDEADDSNEWDFSMKDVNKDGINDLIFGPEAARGEVYSISYLWDDKKKDFTGPDGKQGEHFHRLKKPGFDPLKKLGGLGYKLNNYKKKEAANMSPVTKEEVLARKLHKLPDFKSMSMDEALTFFAPGKTYQSDAFKSAPTVFPEGLNSLTPKQAAFTYAQANRNTAQRNAYLLKIDDRNSVAPPKKGWVVYKEQSALSYNFSRWLWAVNLDKNYLLYFTNSTIGAVFGNPLVDATGYQIRMIKLTPEETAHISGTLWWLNRIRSKNIKRNKYSLYMNSSSADGYCSFHQVSEEHSEVHYSYVTHWNSFGGLKNNWNKEYNKTVCGNLAGEFCMQYLPKYLGERWSNYSALEHHNLYSSTEEKLADRHDSDELRILKKTIAEIFQFNKTTPVPGEIMMKTAEIIGDLGLKEFKKDLMLLKTQFKDPIPFEKEFLSLTKELKGKNKKDFYTAEKGTEKAKIVKKFAKLNHLKAKLEIGYHWSLKKGLEAHIEQLDLLDDLPKLSLLAESEEPQAFWAQRQMRKHYPDDYRISLFNVAISSEQPLKQEQAIELYLKLYPDHGGKLVHTLSPENQVKHCLSLFPAYKAHHPEHLDEVLVWIMTKARDPDTKWKHRYAAVSLLIPANFPTHEKKIYPLLIAIASEPDVKKENYEPHPHSQCIESLIQWPKAKTQWKEISKLAEPRKGSQWNLGKIQRDLITLSKHCGPEARAEMVALLENKLLNGAGLVEEKIHTVLKNDYRECLPVIERLTTLTPQEEQHEKATSSQSTFPLGRHNYHAARHVRALWSEHDPKTQAKLWAAMGYHHPEIFLEASTAQNLKSKYELNTAGKILLTNLDKDKATKLNFLTMVKESDGYYKEYAKALGELIEQSK